MTLSCCIWALSGPEKDVLSQVAGLGFTSIDVQPHMLASEVTRKASRDLGLSVACMAASFQMPSGAALDSADEAARRQAVAHLKQGIDHGAALGARAAYVVPGNDGAAAVLDRYSQSLQTAADYAAEAGLKLCIEHFPGRALPTVAATLDFLAGLNHPNLYLLLDIGHLQMSGEAPAATIKAAGDRLGYVHLDDNDGIGDLHWSLLDGVLTEASLRQTFAALDEIGYEGPLSLELSPALADPASALARSREVVMGIMA
jgi:sugar phosphate isomerase/epimerase